MPSCCNAQLDERHRRKEFIFERDLLNYKRMAALDRKRTKEERDIFNQVRRTTVQ